jgi:hypothetical protein
LISGSLVCGNNDKMSDAAAKKELQAALNEMIEEEPWKIGFSEVGKRFIFCLAIGKDRFGYY